MIDNLVSIVTPVYNAEKYLSQAIESVINQTWDKWELLLIDDCSKDSSADLINKYASLDDRIKYIKMNENSGAARTRNIGIENAKGRYVAFLDSDDIWLPNKLERQLKLMNENNYAFVFTSYRYMLNDSSLTDKVARAPKQIDYEGLLKNTIIGCSTVLLDRYLVGDFRMTNVRKGQDTATWLQILKKIDYAYGIYDDLVYYRISSTSLSHNKVNAIKRTWNTYRNIEKLSLAKAIYVFCFYAFNAVKKRVVREKPTKKKDY